jgi:hypothetical protein
MKMNPSYSRAVVFYIQSKNMVIEKRDVTNRKGKSRTEINFRKMRSSQISLFHHVTSDALDDSIGGIEAENGRLKDHFKEFEEAFIATPEFASPLAKNMCYHCSQDKSILHPPCII